MLTATYTLVALSVEQATVRMNLQSFQKYVRTTLMQQNSITLAQLESACATLNQIYQACHWRKIDMYLIPAIRQATERADHLLDELAHLNQAALDAVRQLQAQYGALADGRDEKIGNICASIETCCAALLLRLEKEEQELFAVARRVIGGEVWFEIANKLMLHDKEEAESRRSMPSAAAGPAFAGLPGAVDARAAARHAAARAANDCRPAPADGDAVPVPDLQALPVVNIDAAALAPSGLPARRGLTAVPLSTK
jgi:hemerythrin-like domain-containing protein